MLQKTPSIPWGRIGAGMIAIVFSVLLALVLDDWRQKRDERKVVESVMLSLRAELERNQLILETALPYHETMLDTFRYRLDALERGRGSLVGSAQLLELTALDKLGFESGIGTEASLSTGAWEAARASGAMTRIGIDELYLLSAAYTIQGHVDRALQRLLDKRDGYARALVERERAAAALIDFASGLSEVVARERELCATYRIVVRRLADAEPDAEGLCGSGNVTIR